MDSRSNSQPNYRWYVVLNILILVMLTSTCLLMYQSHMDLVRLEKARLEIERQIQLISQHSGSDMSVKRVARSVQNEPDYALVQMNATESSVVQRRAQQHEGIERTSTINKRRRNKKRSKKIKSTAVHFVAFVDEDKIHREVAEGKRASVGRLTEHGFIPKDPVYNIWKPEPYSNTKVFRYNATSGKVTVTRSGIYLIYGQMVFFGTRARVSYGIHINDEIRPFIESMVFSLNHHRPKREALFNVTNEGVSKRHRREIGTYSQCNTLAVTYLKKGDKVFVKSLEREMPIVSKKYLTFWGMAAL